jgi:hypothetical protein
MSRFCGYATAHVFFLLLFLIARSLVVLRSLPQLTSEAASRLLLERLRLQNPSAVQTSIKTMM